MFPKLVQRYIHAYPGFCPAASAKRVPESGEGRYMMRVGRRGQRRGDCQTLYRWRPKARCQRAIKDAGRAGGGALQPAGAELAWTLPL